MTDTATADTIVIDQPGIYDIPEAAYHADPVPGGSLSSSGARKLLPPGCPARFAYERDHPPPSKQVFDFGSAAHKTVLGAGPDLAIIEADDWRTKAAREQRDAAYADGQTPVLAHEYDQIVAMADAIRGHPLAPVLLDRDRGDPEQTLVWQHGPTGVWCRALVDWLPHPRDDRRLLAVDYKTATSADPDQFSRSVANFGYHQQAAWYADGIAALGYADDVAFLFIVQEKDPPYLVTVCELDDTAVRIGRRRNRQALDIYRQCTDAGVWPGYGDDVHLISLPAWAEAREEYA